LPHGPRLVSESLRQYDQLPNAEGIAGFNRFRALTATPILSGHKKAPKPAILPSSRVTSDNLASDITE
jgi:hypothetical protein